MKYLGDRSSLTCYFQQLMHELSGGASAGDGEAPRYIEGGPGGYVKVMSTVMSSRGNEVRLLQMLPLGNKGDAMEAPSR